MARRYRALKSELAAHASKAGLAPFPFNSAFFFALVGLPPGKEANQVREHLIATESLGTIAFPEVNALRIAYCSIAEAQIPELVARLVRGVGTSPDAG